MSGTERPDEFETIDRLLRPLADHPAARGLADDCAVLAGPGEGDLVLTHDTLVEGVHFLPDDPLDLVARKLLRVNLSDLAAKGAEPFGYLLSVSWSPRCGWPERERFVAGLAEDQARFGLTLLGGDTTGAPDRLVVGATLLGRVPPGAAPARSGARPGDRLLVSGTIGDGWLGLLAARGELTGPHAVTLAKRYRLPEPRLALREAVRRAHAAADVSDGLLADAGRIAEASGTGVEIDLERLPLSDGAAAWLAGQADPADARVRLAAGGDDYELVLAVDPAAAAEVMALARAAGVSLTEVGGFGGTGLRVRCGARVLSPARTGWRHG